MPDVSAVDARHTKVSRVSKDEFRLSMAYGLDGDAFTVAYASDPRLKEFVQLLHATEGWSFEPPVATRRTSSCSAVRLAPQWN